MISKTICPLPFVHQHIHPDGEIRFCCAAHTNTNLSEQGTALNITTNKLIDAWNGPSIRQLRLELINGGTPESCNHCWARENQEHTAGTSLRLDFLKRIPISTIANRIDHAKNNDGFVNQNPYDFAVMAGNLCNLACKMCSPQYSTSFSKFFKNLKIEKFSDFRFSKKTNELQHDQEHYGLVYDWPNRHSLFDIFSDYQSDMKSIFFIGGEPTIIDGVLEFIDQLIERNLTSVYPLISTNCTNINANLLNQLGKFDSCGLNLSIDGMDEIAYIQRTPSRWTQIEQNIGRIMSWSTKQKQAGKNVHINVHTVVTSMNIHQIPKLWSFLNARYRNADFSISFGIVVEHNQNFSIRLIPQQIIDIVKQEFLTCSKKFPASIYDTVKKFEYVLNETEFATDFEDIHFQIEQLQIVHPDLDLKKIYSIYY